MAITGLRAWAAAGVGAALLAGCSTVPRDRPTPPPFPDSWNAAGGLDAAAASAAPQTEAAFWAGFADPTLSLLTGEAAQAAPSLRIARARLREARALNRQTLSAYLPQFSAQAGGQYTRVEDGPQLTGSFQSFLEGGGSVAREDEQFIGSYGPAVSWEIPLFQRVEAAAFGARANRGLATADLRAAEVALAADAADAYVSLRAAQQRRTAFQEAAQLQAQLAGVLETAAKAGFAAPADAADARRLAATLESRLPDAEIAVRGNLNALSVLRGRAPGAEDAELRALLEAQGPVPAPPPVLGAAAPAEFIRIRPDIASAEAQALIAAADVGIARADLLPQFNLTGQLGVSDNIIGSAAPERLAQITASPSVTIPLFGWGRRLAAIAQRDARLEAALAQYEQTVAAAIAEGHAALLAQAQGGLRLRAAQTAEAAAAENAAGLRAAYDAGIASLADRLRADQQLIDARVSRIEAEAAAARAAIGVYRAFAGQTAPPAAAPAEIGPA